MAEYIEREAAVKAFNNFDAGRADSPPFTLLTPEEFAEYLYELPAADVAPVVHGRWSDAGFGELPKHAPYGWACSVCGGISFNNEYIYCPNCGAKMDGGADHEAD